MFEFKRGQCWCQRVVLTLTLLGWDVDLGHPRVKPMSYYFKD